MRENLIINTSGATYKEIREEKTDVTIRKFLRDEMRIPDADGITINSSHRMGQASGNYNRMLIARIPKRGDHNKIFDNAKVLHGSNYSITKQIPPEIDERRQFAWAEYKKAKSEKKPARFDGGTLVVGGTPVSRFQPLTIPAIGTSLRGLPSPTLACGSSDVTVEGHHTFQAWAIPAQSVGDVREGLDQMLQKGDLAGATHVPYAYRFKGVDGRLVENLSPMATLMLVYKQFVFSVNSNQITLLYLLPTMRMASPSPEERRTSVSQVSSAEPLWLLQQLLIVNLLSTNVYVRIVCVRNFKII